MVESTLPSLNKESFTKQNIVTLFLGILVMFLMRWILMERRQKSYNLPPGPKPYPIVGNLPQIISKRSFYDTIMEFRKTYGGIFKINVGPFSMYFISDLELVKEGFLTKGDSILGRPAWMFIVKKIFKDNGIFFNSGPTWRHMRRFTLTTMRNFGVGKKSLEERIGEEFQEISRAIEAHNGEAFFLKKHIGDGVMNVIYHIVFGQRLEYTHPKFNQFIEIFDYIFKNAGLQMPENFLPWLHYFRRNSPAHKLIENDQILQAHVMDQIEEHRKSFDPENIRDFIDVYISVEKDKNSKDISESNIFRTIVDLFTAGSETTATSLLWAFLYVTKYPEVQEKCRQEIKKITGFSRWVSMADKDEMPYVNATILEIQRIAPVAAFIPPHVAEEDLTIGKYDVPKGTMLDIIITAIQHDPKYWESPEKFLPERWLTKDNKIRKHEAFLPFSLGPRSCIGEPLARMEMFLFFTNLLQRFKFTDPPDEPVSVSARMTGISYQPITTRICAKPL